MFIRKNIYKGTINTFKQVASQTLPITGDYMRLMYDLDNSTFVLRKHFEFTDDELLNYILVGTFFFSDTEIYGYTNSGQSFTVNVNITLNGNGEKYLPNNAITYSELGDSITMIGDSKDGIGGYIGNGYGQLLCKALKIPYEKHHPTGISGYTTCDIVDAWIGGLIGFPNNGELATIFLGTNDWGEDKNALGNQDDYLNKTYSSSNKTTYGALREIVDRFRAIDTRQIIFITPMQRGAFAYTGGGGELVFRKSAVAKVGNLWEYTENTNGYTLKDVVDAIKWVCQYESFVCIDLFNDFIFDKDLLCQELTPSSYTITNFATPVYQEFLYDNLHPTTKGFKKIAGRLINNLKYSL